MIAISGLASELQEAYDGLLGMYLAGLWRENLVSQLTWYVPGARKEPRPSSYQCPSWSWLSIDSAVEFLGPPSDSRIKYLASVLECTTLFPSGNEFDLLRGEHLRILCPLLCVELVENQKHDAARDDGSWWLCPRRKINFVLDFLTEARDEDNTLIISTLSRNVDEKLRWKLARPLDTQSKQPDHFYLAIIRQIGDRSIYGLAVRPTDLTNRTFRRFGAFIWYEASGEDPQVNLDTLKTATQDLTIPLCGTRKPDGRYEITIV